MPSIIDVLDALSRWRFAAVRTWDRVVGTEKPETRKPMTIHGATPTLGAFDFLNPFIQKQLGSTVRQLLNILAGALVGKALLTESQAYNLTDALMPLAIAGIAQLWTYFDNKRSRQKLVIAQASDERMSEREIIDEIKAGNVPPITLPKDVTPRPAGAEPYEGTGR